MKLFNFFKKKAKKEVEKTTNQKQVELSEKDHAKERKNNLEASSANKPVSSQNEESEQENPGLLYLPKFDNMDMQISKSDIVSTVALTHTFLKLTYLNPFPFEQDPVFKTTYDLFYKSFSESLYTPDVSMEQKYLKNYGEKKTELLLNLSQDNWKVLEHYYTIGENLSNIALALKPAFNCLQTALTIVNEYIAINYCYLLLKDKSGILNSLQREDLLNALGNCSGKLKFVDGLIYATNELKK